MSLSLQFITDCGITARVNLVESSVSQETPQHSSPFSPILLFFPGSSILQHIEQEADAFQAKLGWGTEDSPDLYAMGKEGRVRGEELTPGKVYLRVLCLRAPGTIYF